MTNPNPFENDTWVKMCLKTGAITPPRGSSTERINKLTAYGVIAVMTVGAIISWLAFLMRH